MVSPGLASERDTHFKSMAPSFSLATTDKCFSMVKLSAELFTSTGTGESNLTSERANNTLIRMLFLSRFRLFRLKAGLFHTFLSFLPDQRLDE